MVFGAAKHESALSSPESDPPLVEPRKRKSRLYRPGREQPKPLMALEFTLAFFAFWFYTRPGQISDLSLSLFSGGTAHGCTEDDDYVGDVEGDVEVVHVGVWWGRLR